MVESYKTIYLGGEEEIVEKKSRFIAVTEHVETEEEAIAFIEKIKKKHWNARHHCFAYIIGTKQQIIRCSDDGEPSGTAGRPILDVLLGAGLCNTVIVVIRYFGGTLLGTGGLVRAYSGASKAGIEGSLVILRQRAKKVTIECDYSWIGKIQYLLAQRNIKTLDSEYGEGVVSIVLVPFAEYNAFCKEITESTNAQAKVEEVCELYYSVLDGECLLFDH